MAIDTAARQMAMLNFSFGDNSIVLPIPDGAYSEADTIHLLDLYTEFFDDAPSLTTRPRGRWGGGGNRPGSLRNRVRHHEPVIWWL